MINWIVNYINEQFPKSFIAKHLARVVLYELDGIDALYPDVKRLAKKLLVVMENKNKPIYIVPVTGTFRNIKQQNTLSSNVTNAGGLQSYHQYGIAFDVAFKDYNWSPPSFDWWNELGKEGEKLGLIWGGSFQDYGHFEWHGRNESMTWQKLKPYFANE